ncbi:MAG TPA: peptidoglycan DD-metalloendopeptidase family protein [Xanthobacteraceae bacterium]|jgi:murein DD-endopeptidase MepM/ murein hydrolase activator NlpD
MPRRSFSPYRDSVSAPRGAAPTRWAGSHDARRVRLRPIAFWLVIGTLVIMVAWSITTATYFAFREDVLTGLIARQAEMQLAYEDRIAELRAQIDRFSGRQLLDQEQYEKKLEQILRRQAALESRADALNGLGDATGAIKQPARGGLSGVLRAILPKPARDKGAALIPDRPATDSRSGFLAKTTGGIGVLLERLQASLDRLEQRQAGMVGSLADNYDAKARRMRGVLIELGLEAGKAPGEGAVGGPFVPVNVSKGGVGFERQLQRIHVARAQVTRLTRTLATIPVRKPLDGGLDLQSGFGVRVDPFLGTPAMHTGLDLHGETGDPVRATADGTVVAAGWSGGYGRVVDIDHHNGLSTRYGHLSSVEVRVGQSVKRGQIVGKVGSTGRSTGPHLHYETRLKGEAVDPQKFLRAGEKLDSSL